MEFASDEFLDYICGELDKIGLSEKELKTLKMIVQNALFIDFLNCIDDSSKIDKNALMKIEIQYKTALCYEKGYKANDILQIKSDTISQYEQKELNENNKITINFFN